MKKIYSLALAMLTFGSAAYAGNVNDFENMQARQLDDAALQSLSIAATSTVKKAPGKVVAFNSLDEIYGVYNMAVEVPLNGQPEGFQKKTIEIKPSATEGCVDIIGIASTIPVTAQVDLATRTLTLKKQFAFHNTFYNADIYFTPMKANSSGNLIETDEFLLQFSEGGQTISGKDEEGNKVELISMQGPLWIGVAADGTLNEYAALPVYTKDGTGFFSLNCCPLINDFATLTTEELPLKNLFEPVFSYKASEWEDCGEANFTDGFLAPALLSQPLAAYPVKVQRNKTNPNLVVLVDPYGASTPWAQLANQDGTAVDTNTTPGYIMFDFQNPSCVMVIPMVNSGFSYNGEDFYFANFGGQNMYIEGYSMQEVEDSYDYLQYTKAAYDKSGQVLKIYDNMYATVEDLYVYSEFTDKDDNPLSTETVVEFSVDVTDSAAVNGIEADSNVAPKYYNLQGMEVKAPVAGELVIVKQGGKSYKTIAK